MRFCWRRRFTKALLIFPALVVACFLLSTSLYSLLSVSLDLKFSETRVGLDYKAHQREQKQNEVIKLRDVVTQKSIPILSWDRPPSDPSLKYPNSRNHAESARPIHLPSIAKGGNSSTTLPTVPIGRQKKILILAYYRSGSTLTGSFFDHQPGTFYSFEPLHSLFRLTERKRPMFYFNGRIRERPAWNELNDLSLQILRAFYSCDFYSIDWHTMTSGFGSKSSAYREYVACVKSLNRRDFNFMRKVQYTCLPILIQTCKTSDTIVVKTIRMRMALAEQLRKVIPDLKIVHLFRDPRGMACSLQRKSCRPALKGVKAMCERLTSDVVHRQTLTQRHPANFYAVQYEALIETPLRTLTHMFEFLGLVLNSEVAKWIYQNVYSGLQDNRALAVTKSDSIATAYNWTTRINWDLVRSYQDTCSEFFDAEGYPYFSNIQDVRHFRLPVRNVTQQIIELKQFIEKEHG